MPDVFASLTSNALFDRKVETSLNNKTGCDAALSRRADAWTIDCENLYAKNLPVNIVFQSVHTMDVPNLKEAFR